jgi:surfactin synthase thioesterase subunit
LLESYEPDQCPPLNVPITALTGAGDTATPSTALEGWASQSACAFRATQLPGGHFFPAEAGESFREVISGILDQAVQHTRTL